ncbi:MAG TPA: hypothetical protein QF646_02635 [Candidatus Poseidoniales archaeon]|nr:hypothetical protein [Candidatus Poseidoniales archaeon]
MESPDLAHEALAALMQRDESLPRAVPPVSSAIAEQARHMSLPLPSASICRRIRDIVVRFRPERLLEVNASIGLVTSWMLAAHVDHGFQPHSHHIIDRGGKFGVILQRLIDRFESPEHVHLGIAEYDALLAESRAALALADSAPYHLPKEVDMVIVDVMSHPDVTDVSVGLSHLRKGGLLIVVEPPEPPENASLDAPSVVLFQSWINLIHREHDKRAMAFIPITGGVLVGMQG